MTACTMEGVVLERGTDKPLPNAFVIAEWHGSAGLVTETRSLCHGSQVTQSNSEGKYRFPLNLSSYAFGKASVDVYMPNYQAWLKTEHDNPILLDPRRGSNTQKFQAISNLPLGAYCDGNRDDKAFIAVRKTRALELQALAATDEEHRIADAYLQGVELLQFGMQAAEERQRARAANRARESGSGLKP